MINKYDIACNRFTEAMQKSAGWKHNYVGAAYTTRLVAAMQEAREACDKLEAELSRLGELK